MKINLFVILLFHFQIFSKVMNISWQCLTTFDQLTRSMNSSNLTINLFECPSSCFTSFYLINHNEYQIFGNEIYSGNSLICKSAYHDGRLSSIVDENFKLIIRNNSIQSKHFPNSLRNGILSSKSTSKYYFEYEFINSRINESVLIDMAIEHDGYLYSSNIRSTIRCRSENEIYPIEQLPIDQGWKFWSKDRLKSFSTSRLMSRNESKEFCLKNFGNLFFWSNENEFDSLLKILSSKYFQIFSGQRRNSRNDSLIFHIDLKRIELTKENQSEEFCFLIHLNNSIQESIDLIRIHCHQNDILAYPLCRFNSTENEEEEEQFIYRLDKDDYSPGLTGLIDYCSQFGGDPIYANNAYEWQIIQEIMFFDIDFDVPYAYVGLESRSKQLIDAYWMPRNRSYNNSLDYLIFSSERDRNGFGYHLSKSESEMSYTLYDINPSTDLNRLRFCRKSDYRYSSSIKRSNECQLTSCQSKCEEIEMKSNENENENLRFGFWFCRSKKNKFQTILSQSFPIENDFQRENFPEENFVSIRQRFDQNFSLILKQKNNIDRSSCFEYFYFDRQSTFDQRKEFICSILSDFNKTFSQITFPKDFYGLTTIALRNRRMSGHHFRFIDYFQNDQRCHYQGIRHPMIDQCICAPGFYGDQCQFSCPTGYYGQRCSFRCSSSIDDYCQGLLICLVDPYGCSCYSGWFGTYCNQSCPSNRYGPNCLYQCSCSSCNRFTGRCDCNGTECYEGIYRRSDLESLCSISSSKKVTNVILIIILPIICGTILILSIGFILYYKYFHHKNGQMKLKN